MDYVVVIQKIWRGSLVRDVLRTYSKSAILIQRCYIKFRKSSRSSKQYPLLPFTYKLHFSYQNKAAALIQVYCRRHREITLLKSKRYLALSLHPLFRERMTCKLITSSAILIQSRVRQFLLLRKLGQVNKAASKIQKCWRGISLFSYHLNKQTRSFSSSILSGVRFPPNESFYHSITFFMKIQNFVKMFIVFSKLKMYSSAAIRIQHVWKKNISSINSRSRGTKKLYSPCLSSFQLFRGLVNVSRNELETFARSNLLATIKIQALFRSWKYQLCLSEKELKSAVIFAPLFSTVIHFRPGFRSAYDTELLETIKIQKLFRGWSCRRKYSRRTLTTDLQTATEICVFRNYSHRQNCPHQSPMEETKELLQLFDDENYSLLHSHAVCIQKTFRRYLMQRNLNIFSCSSLSIQKRWKKVMSEPSNQTFMEYQKDDFMMNSFITLQKLRRGHLSTTSRSKLLKEINVAECHLSSQRSISCENKLISDSSKSIAQFINKTSNAATTLMNSTCTIPTSFTQKKPYCVEIVDNFLPSYKNNNFASPVQEIKASLNHDSCQSSEKKGDVASTCLQGICLGSRFRSNLCQRTSASMVIQNRWASYHAHNTHCQQERFNTTIKIMQRLNTRCITSRILQKRLQGVTKKRRALNEKKSLQANLALSRIVIILQSYARMRILAKIRDDVLRNVILIQSFFRSILARNFRCLLDSKKTLNERSWLLYQCTKKIAPVPVVFHDTIKGVIALQNAVRRSFASRSKAAKIIQLAFFSWKMKSTLRQVIESVIRIQCATRGCLVRHHMKSNRLRIQSKEITHQSPREILPASIDSIESNALIRIQSTFRRYQQIRKAKAKKIVALALEDLFIARKVQCSLNSAVITIQRQVRRFLFLSKSSRKMVASASKIQSALNHGLHHIECSRIRNTLSYESMIKAIVESQALSRGRRERKMYKHLHFNCIVIQKSMRMFSSASFFRRTRIKIIRIQAFLRMSLLRSRYLLLHERTAAIQATCRWHLESVYSKVKMDYVVVIQKIWRGSLVRDVLRSYSKSAILIQRCYIKFRKSSRSSKQYPLLPFTYKLHFSYQNKAAAMIQIYFRRHREITLLKSKRYLALSLHPLLRERMTCKLITSSAILIQSRVRQFLLLRKLGQVNKAASKIQKAWSKCVILLRRELLHVLKIISFPGRPIASSYSFLKARILLPRDSRGQNRIKCIAHQLPRSHECGMFIETVLNSVAVVIQSISRRYLARSVFFSRKHAHHVALSRTSERKSIRSVNHCNVYSNERKSPNSCQILFELDNKKEASSSIIQRFFRTRVMNRGVTCYRETRTKIHKIDKNPSLRQDEERNIIIDSSLCYSSRVSIIDEYEALVLSDVYKKAEFIADGTTNESLSLDMSPCVLKYVHIAKSVLERFSN